MSGHHLAGGPDLTRELTDAEFANLHSLGLIAPCHGCTRLLHRETDADEDEVVYHPTTNTRGDQWTLPEIEEEIREALKPKKH